MRIIVLILSFVLTRELVSSPDDTLAVVGDRVILSSEFSRRYQEKLRSVGLTDNMEARRGYLRNLVDDAIIIEYARRSGLDTTRAALRELERVKTQELLTAYVLEVFLPKAKATDEALWRLYRHLNTKLRVRHLYARTMEEAKELARELAEGKTFEELARRVFTDPWLRDNGGSLGSMTVDEMDPEFERAAYALRVGEVSAPVRTMKGYSIIRVDEIVVNPLLTESEFANAKERLVRFARARAVEQTLKKFTQDLRVKLRLTVEPSALDRLWNLQRSEEMIHTESELLSPQELSAVAVRTMDRPWTLREVVDELAGVPEVQTKWVRSRGDLEDMIAGLVMRERVCREARKRGFDKRDAYREKVRFSFETYLLESVESSWKNSIVVSQDSVRSYYDLHPNVFLTHPEVRLDGILVDRRSLADTILSELRIGVEFSRLARQYSIQKATAARGGDMGWFRREQLDRWGEEIMTMVDEQWKGPIEFEGKYLFVCRTEGRVAALRPFAECEPEIRSILTSIAWPEHRRRNIERALRNVPMRWDPDRLPQVELSERIP